MMTFPHANHLRTFVLSVLFGASSLLALSCSSEPSELLETQESFDQSLAAVSQDGATVRMEVQAEVVVSRAFYDDNHAADLGQLMLSQGLASDLYPNMDESVSSEDRGAQGWDELSRVNLPDGRMRLKFRVALVGFVPYSQLYEERVRELAQNSLRLPVYSNIEGAFARLKAKCLDAQTVEAITSDVPDYEQDIFAAIYFNPSLPGCNVPEAERSYFETRITIVSEHGEASYPEFQRIVEDQKFDVVLHFGGQNADADGVAEPNDPIFGRIEEWRRALRGMGYRQVDPNMFTQTIGALRSSVLIISPSASLATAAASIGSADFVYYMGHSSIGGPRLFDSWISALRADPLKYRVVMLMTCWSAQLYAPTFLRETNGSQVYDHSDNMDVIASYTGTFFRGIPLHSVALRALLLGSAATLNGTGSIKPYSYAAILKKLNDQSARTFRSSPESFRVLGAANNVFRPAR